MRVVVTQPYVPEYRVPLFDEIERLLRADGHDFAVASGKPAGAQAGRADAADAPWLHRLESATLQVAGREVGRRRLPPSVGVPDVLVTELDVKNSLAWSRGASRPPRLVLWGHGKPYVSRPTWMGERLKRRIIARADHVMTYTGGGREYLVDALRVDAAKVTAIGNAVDTSDLVSGRDRAIASGDAARAREAWGGGPHALYVGGLDASKRIPLLADAARELRAISPGSTLVVCGDGADRALVESAPGIAFLGREPRERIGALAASCDALWMPGRVGLVALDALALGLPIHTADGALHAPEVELVPPALLHTLPAEPAAFARDSVALMRDPTRVPCGDGPTVSSVARAFVDAATGTMAS